MPKVLVNGIQMHYQQEGAGPDVVLIHGVTGDLSSWYVSVMPPVARKFRVTAYDLRGHGYSGMTPSGYTSAHMAADLHGLLDGLAIERAHLVAHSFGAAVALHCAVLYPERVASLVLADPGTPALTPFADPKTWLYLAEAQDGLRQRGLSIPDDKWNDLEYGVRLALENIPRVPFGLRRWAERSTRRAQRLMASTSALREAQEVAGLTLERIADIRHPTLAIYGEVSRWLQTAPYLQARMPNCQVAVVRGVAHFFALAKPELLVRHILEYVGGLEGGRCSDPTARTSISSSDENHG